MLNAWFLSIFNNVPVLFVVLQKALWLSWICPSIPSMAICNFWCRCSFIIFHLSLWINLPQMTQPDDRLGRDRWDSWHSWGPATRGQRSCQSAELVGHFRWHRRLFVGRFLGQDPRVQLRPLQKDPGIMSNNMSEYVQCTVFILLCYYAIYP